MRCNPRAAGGFLEQIRGRLQVAAEEISETEKQLVTEILAAFEEQPVGLP
jgi:hypothetical protein